MNIGGREIINYFKKEQFFKLLFEMLLTGVSFVLIVFVASETKPLSFTFSAS